MTLERDFAAWADRADTDALTRVFDATAGRLLLLAAHLTGSGTTAEDLVQATFLAAMARRSTWDRQRPVWPWLATILQNEANMQWRRRGRRREVGLEGAVSVAATAPDPAQLAASEDAFAAVVSAIDAMPLPYRQVLRLRLVHGLQQVEIARALEVPVGTVRAQVHRGLAQLREALPSGVVIAVGAWLTGDGALLAQVRTNVLAQAAMHAATAVTTTGVLLTGGWWTMHGKTVGVVAAGAVLLLCLGLALGVPPILGAGEHPRAPSSPVVADLGAPEAKAAAETADTPDRRVVDVTAGPAWPLVVTVKTRAGQPIAGATVRVWVAARGIGIVNQAQGEGVREEVASGETAADGTLHCSLDQFRQRSVLFRCASFVFIEATQPRGESKEHLLALPRTTEPQPFAADFELSPSIGIVGRVVDRTGAPVRSVDLYWLSPPPTSLFESATGYANVNQRLRDDGGFCIAVSPDRSDRLLGSIAAVHASLGVTVVALPRGDEPASVGGTIDVGTLVLDGRDAIRGQVVLADGSALGDYPLIVRTIDPAIAADLAAVRQSFWKLGRQQDPLEVRHGGLRQVQAQPITLADGSFVCAGLDPETTYAVAVRDYREMIVAVARVGGEPVRLVVDRQLMLLEVRDDVGEKLQGVWIMASGFDPAGKRPSHRLHPGFPAVGHMVSNPSFSVDAHGRRMLLSPFGWIWRLVSTNENVQPDVVRHEAFAGVYRAERTIVLRPETRFGSLHLVVVDEHGRPMPGQDARGQLMYQTYLKCVDRDVERNGRRAFPPADGMFRDLPAGRWRLSVFVGQQLHYPIDAYARGIHEQEIVIDDACTTEVKVVAKPAGLVGFLPHSASLTEDGTWEELKICAEPGGIDVPFHVYDRGLPRHGILPPRHGMLFIGKPSFPPGKHAFLISAKGYHAARCEVDVAADKLVEARVEMFPK